VLVTATTVMISMHRCVKVLEDYLYALLICVSS